jgi:hypothetical protein
MKQQPKTEFARLAEETAGLRAEVAEVREQGRLTLELVRVILELVRPKDNRGGPTLDELLATMIVQLRELTTIARATQAAIARLEQRSGPNGAATTIGRPGLSGQAPR